MTITAVRKIKIISGITDAKTQINTNELLTGDLDTESPMLPRSPTGVCVIEWLDGFLEVKVGE